MHSFTCNLSAIWIFTCTKFANDQNDVEQINSHAIDERVEYCILFWERRSFCHRLLTPKISGGTLFIHSTCVCKNEFEKFIDFKHFIINHNECATHWHGLCNWIINVNGSCDSPKHYYFEGKIFVVAWQPTTYDNEQKIEKIIRTKQNHSENIARTKRIMRRTKEPKKKRISCNHHRYRTLFIWVEYDLNREPFQIMSHMYQ